MPRLTLDLLLILSLVYVILRLQALGEAVEHLLTLIEMMRRGK